MVVPYPVSQYGIFEGPLISNQQTVKEQNNNAVYQSYSQTFRTVRHKRDFASVNRRRFLAGTTTPWIPPSNYERYVYRIRHSGPGTWNCNKRWYFDNSLISEGAADLTFVSRKVARPNSPFGSFLQLSPTFTGDLNNALTEAKVKAMLDLANGKANMGETLATSKQTLNLFLDTAADLMKIARDIRRGRVYKQVKHLNVKKLKALARSGDIPRSVANRWLQFWFGWKPLVSDAYGLYETFVGSMSKPALLVHGRASSKIEEDLFVEEVEDLSSSLGTTYNFLDRFRIDVRCNVTARVNNADYLRTINSVGLLNPAQTAWELIPFSFVVDWFLPVGKVLEAMSAPAGLSFVGGHTTIRHIRRSSATVAPSKRRGSSPPFVEVDSFGFKRTVLTGFPRPALYARSFHKSATRFATVAALLVQLTK